MIDLKELMEDRSAHQPTAGNLRLTQVRQKITTRRHRRIAAGAVSAVVVLLLIGGYQLMPIRRAASPHTPAATPSATIQQIEGFAEYEGDQRVVAATRVPVAGGGASLVWTPNGEDFKIKVHCKEPLLADALRGELLLNGKHFATLAGCLLTVFGDRSALDRHGIQVGMPTTVQVASLRSKDGDGVPLPAGDIGLAISVTVPFTEVPLPPRPAKLTPIEPIRTCHEKSPPAIDGPNYLRSDPSDPLKPRTMTITWRDYLYSQTVAQTPGLLHITYNGVEAGTRSFWDYQQRSSFGRTDTREPRLGPTFSAKQGDQVVVTVTPQHFTGEWQIRFIQSSETSVCWIDQKGAYFAHL